MRRKPAPDHESGAGTEAAADIIALAKERYSNFVGMVWPILSGGRAPFGELERHTLDWAVMPGPGRGNKRDLFCHREWGKSTGITYPLPAWKWLCDPTLTGASYNKSAKKATEALTATRQLLKRHPLLRHLEPPQNSWHKDTFDHFHVNGATNTAVPSLKVLGSTSMTTGGRIDFGTLDDFETIENSITRESRGRTLERAREIVRTVRDGGLLVAVHTYARDESIHQNLIDDDGWEHMIVPLLYPTEEEIDLATNKKTGQCYYSPLILKWLRRGYDYLDRPVRAGMVVQPERFSPEYVAEKQGGSLADFRRHYMGIRRSNVSDEYAIRLSDIMVMPCIQSAAPAVVAYGLTTGKDQRSTVREDIEVDAFGTDAFRSPAYTDPVYLPYQATFAHLDPAGYGKDEMAWGIASRLNGTYFLRKVHGARLRPDADQDPSRSTLNEAINSLVNDIQLFQVRTLQVEEQFGGIAIAATIRRLLSERAIPCNVVTKFATGQKETRLLGMARPILSTHRAVFDEAVANDKVLQHQLTRLTANKGCLENDDRLEAALTSLHLAAEGDLSTPTHVLQRHSLEAKRDELLDNLGLAKPTQPRWGDHRRLSQTS